jgi:hypothetical protein
MIDRKSFLLQPAGNPSSLEVFMQREQRKKFAERIRNRGAGDDAAAEAVAAVERFEKFASRHGRDVDHVSVDVVRKYMDLLIQEGGNTEEEILALARYANMTEQTDIVVYLLAIFGTQGVFASITDRVSELAGEETKTRIFDDFVEPPFGSPPEVYPRITRDLLGRLQGTLSADMWRKVLAGNHHKIPQQSFAEERKRFLELADVRAYLEDLHQRSVRELEQYMKEGRLWYEQKITPRVVEFVRGNQEVLAGVYDGERIYATKIPYDPDRYLQETDPLMKRYYACHCPFARSAILQQEPGVPEDWCYCSGGYGKLRFDVAFDRDHDVEVLESVLGGSERCRFAVIHP